MGHAIRSCALGLVVLSSLPTVHWLRGQASAHFSATQRYEDVYHLPPPDWLVALSLGQREALADLLWMKALVYFGEQVQRRGEVAHVFEYADAVLALDPGFARAYRWAGMAAMYRPTAVPVEDIRRGVGYLERGALRFPDDGELVWDLGASLSYELAPRVTDATEKTSLRLRGLEYMQAAARLGAGPEWLVLSNATELRRLGQIDRAIRHLEEMYATIRDEEVRGQIEGQLERLRSEAFAEAVRSSALDEQARRRRDFPYLDAGLYSLVGPRGVLDEASFYRNPFLPEDRAAALDGGAR